MSLCLPAHQHRLLQIDITTVSATINVSFNYFFPYTWHSWDYLFFYFHLLLQSDLSSKILILHFYQKKKKKIWKCDFFFKTQHSPNFNFKQTLNTVIVEFWKMLNMKTHLVSLVYLAFACQDGEAKQKEQELK